MEVFILKRNANLIILFCALFVAGSFIAPLQVLAPNYWVQNPGFETGDLSYWSTDYASVGTGYYAHWGNYGCCLARYASGQYSSAYIYQGGMTIPYWSLESNAITYYFRSAQNHIWVTVYYSDASTDSWEIKKKSANWFFVIIPKSLIDDGKTITGIRFTRGGSTNYYTTAIDDIAINQVPPK